MAGKGEARRGGKKGRKHNRNRKKCERYTALHDPSYAAQREKLKGFRKLRRRRLECGLVWSRPGGALLVCTDRVKLWSKDHVRLQEARYGVAQSAA